MRGKPRLIKLQDRHGQIISENWYIHYYDGKRSRRISTGCQIGAQDHEANLALASFTLEREKPIARQPNELMVAQALADYYEEHGKHIASFKLAQYHEKRLNDHFIGKCVAQLTPSVIEEYIRAGRDRKESNGTIRRDLEHLKAALNHEVAEQRLIYAPKIKLPPPPPPRERTLSEREIKRLLVHCSPHVKTFVQIMRYTGQRPGAVENLTWFQVDFGQRIIHFDRTGKQQTNKRVRPVAMNDNLYRILKTLHKKKQTGHVIEWNGEHAGCVKKAFQRACEKAKLEGVSRYTLRHTTLDRVHDISDEKTAADIGGHTNPRTTRKHYIKSKMDKQRKVLNMLGKNKQGRK